MKDYIYYQEEIEKMILKHSDISKLIITKMFGSALELYELRDLSYKESKKLYNEIKKVTSKLNKEMIK